MNIIIRTKNTTLDSALEIFINEKIGSLEKLLGAGPVEARVEIGLPSKHHRSGPIFYAEVNLKIGGRLLRATSEGEDLRVAIVDVKNELQAEIKKFKEKSKDRARKPKQ